MRDLILGALLAASGTGAGAMPASHAVETQGITVASAFQMPRAEAFGAAFGAIGAVHLFAKMRASRAARSPRQP